MIKICFLIILFFLVDIRFKFFCKELLFFVLVIFMKCFIGIGVRMVCVGWGVRVFWWVMFDIFEGLVE